MITNDISVEQLRRALQIREQIEALQQELNTVMGGGSFSVSAPAEIAPVFLHGKRGRRTMSPTARAAISRAQKARWALYRKDKPEAADNADTGKPKRKMSAAGRAAISAALKARWAAAKASNRNAL